MLRTTPLQQKGGATWALLTRIDNDKSARILRHEDEAIPKVSLATDSFFLAQTQLGINFRSVNGL